MHFDGSNMRNRIFVTFIHICTSNMRILTFSVFVPTYTKTACFAKDAPKNKSPPQKMPHNTQPQEQLQP